MKIVTRKRQVIIATLCSIVFIAVLVGITMLSNHYVLGDNDGFNSFLVKDFVHKTPDDVPVTEYSFAGKLSLIVLPALDEGELSKTLGDFLAKFDPWQQKHMQNPKEKAPVFQMFVASDKKIEVYGDWKDRWQKINIEPGEKLFNMIERQPHTTQIVIVDDDARVVDIRPSTDLAGVKRRLSQAYSRVAMYKFLSDVPMLRKGS